MRYCYCFFILLCTSMSTAFADNKDVSCKQNSCIAVVDAGSTGSRLHIFTVNKDDTNLIQIKEIYNHNFNPGIATVNLNQYAIDNYLKTLFSIKLDAKIPVYFYATAGMRLLPYPKQQSYYNMIEHWFNNQEHWQLMSAKTIKGKEEGVFGWLAINYTLGHFNTTTDVSYAGVLDTGGASVQVTFPVSDPHTVNQEDLMNVNIYGKTIHLFARSFLGLGQNELDHQFLDDKTCFPNQYTLTNGLLAEGNLYQCEQHIAQSVNAVHQVNAIVQPVIHTNPVSHWFGIGGVSYLVQTAPLQVSDNQLTMQELAENANQSLCQQDWDSLYSQYPNNDYLYISCLNAAYFYTLFVNGYGIDPNEKIRYAPLSQSNNDWTLGVVLQQALNQ